MKHKGTHVSAFTKCTPLCVVADNMYSLETISSTQEDLDSYQAYTDMWLAPPKMLPERFTFTLSACKDTAVLLSAKVGIQID